MTCHQRSYTPHCGAVRMVDKKQAAFTQACAEMASQVLRVNLQLASTPFWTLFTALSLTSPSIGRNCSIAASSGIRAR